MRKNSADGGQEAAREVTMGSYLNFTVAAAFLLFGAGCFVHAAIPEPAKTDYLIRSWQSEDGLPQNSITSIAQTGDGYLWMGTFNGLVRFDGVRFSVYDSANTPQLKSSRIVQVFASSSNRLWIVSEFRDLVILENGRFGPLKTSDGKIHNKIGPIWGRPGRI